MAFLSQSLFTFNLDVPASPPPIPLGVFCGPALCIENSGVYDYRITYLLYNPFFVEINYYFKTSFDQCLAGKSCLVTVYLIHGGYFLCPSQCSVRYHCCMREGHQWCGSRVLEVSSYHVHVN